MPILNYTTTVAAEKTVNEIQKILGRCKSVTTVTTEYSGGEPAAILFAVQVFGSDVHFRLPCNKDGVLSALYRDGAPYRYQNEEHGKRVAWRIVKDWVEAQLALVDANQAQIAEVFLPYAIVNGKTMFKMFEDQQAQRLLTDGLSADA